MDQWPNIAVIIPTYNRTSILVDTVDCLQTMAMYPGTLEFYIGVDNDKEGYQAVADKIWTRNQTLKCHVFDGPRRTGLKSGGYLGANLNMLLNRAIANGHQIFMQMDDDHQLSRALDLSPHVEKLMTDDSIGWIRLMGVGFHRYCACLQGHYWRVRWDSPELYIPSNRPHLKHKRFHDVFGVYPTGLKLGETEESFCHQCKNVALAAMAQGKSTPDVAVPLSVLTESSWNHVGQSLQLQGE